MLLGIGIDILSLSRFQGLITRRSPQIVANKICSPIEFSLFNKIPSGSNTEILKFLSTRWVLKEAAYKSFSAHTPITWKTLTISHLSSGQPTIHYIPPQGDTTFGRQVGMIGQGIDLMCTLSHDAGVVVGVVIAQTKS